MSDTKVTGTVLTDPRLSAFADPRLVAIMTTMHTNVAVPDPPVTVADSREKIHDFYRTVDGVMDTVTTMLCNAFKECPDVATETVTIKGVDDNDINLHIHTPKHVTGPVPCVYFIHGGGMGIMSTANDYYMAVRTVIARTGITVIGVEFRNSTGLYGPHPFPAGLNDCMSGLQWTYDNKVVRNFSKIILSGESGGANLSFACAIKAKQEGKLEQIDGVYGMCPFIYGRYGYGDAEEASLPSLSDNSGLSINMKDVQMLASMYLPEGEDPRDYPLAWPYWATDEDVAGLPPHVIHVNELDPFKSEGISYYRKLLRAGVRVRSYMVAGTVHAGELLFMSAISDITNATIRDIHTFCSSL